MCGGNVASDANCGTALEDDSLGLLRCEMAVYVGQHDAGTAPGEHARCRQSHAFGGARDEGRLAFEVIDRVHVSPQFMLRKLDRYFDTARDI